MPASRLPGRGRWARPAARGPRRGAVRQPRVLPYLFIAPAVGLTALFSVVPLGIAIRRSFYGGGTNIFQTKLNFVGLQNYSDALSSGGTQALEVTAIYTVGFIVLAMGFGLATALLLNMKLPGIDRLRAPFIIPLVVPVVATALIWANLFAPQFGFINRILEAFGLHQADFTSSPTLALIMVLTFGVWQFFGENVILYLAALKSLPVDLLEAASVDGAGPWRRFRYVRWPSAAPRHRRDLGDHHVDRLADLHPDLRPHRRRPQRGHVRPSCTRYITKLSSSSIPGKPTRWPAILFLISTCNYHCRGRHRRTRFPP